MFQDDPTLFHAVIAGVGLVLYLFLWFATRDLPRAVRYSARLALLVVAVMPIVLAVFFGAGTPKQETARAPSDRSGGAPPPVASAPPRQEAQVPRPQPGASPPVAAAPPPAQPQALPRAPETSARPPAAAPPAAPAPPPVASAPPSPPPPPAVTAPSAPPPYPPPAAANGAPPKAVLESAPPAAPEDDTSVETAEAAPGSSTGTRGPARARKAARPATDDRWDIVPVFYGTDRGADPAVTTRAGYGSERANRLEIGRAFVTVPKVHQVPNVERPWAYKIPFTDVVIYREAEDPAKHFTLKEVVRLSEADFLSFVRERLAESQRFQNHALVFVHGFNTSFDYALFRTAQIAYDLKFDGAPFVYSWASRGAVGLQDYSYDRESAELARPHFRQFLELVAKRTGAEQVSIIAHSMGHQVLLPVLEDLRREAPAGVKISELILAAPDFERTAFQNLARSLAGFARGVTLYASSNDRALQVSERFWGSPRAGDVPAAGPIVQAGLDTIDISSITADVFGLNHSAYAERTELITDIQLLLQTGERPPSSRLPILRPVDSADGKFWRFPGR